MARIKLPPPDTSTKRTRGRVRMWPTGILKRVSREAFSAVTRSRGFDFMTAEARESAARAYDVLNSGRVTGRLLIKMIEDTGKLDEPIGVTIAGENYEHVLDDITVVPGQGLWINVAQQPVRRKAVSWNLTQEQIDVRLKYCADPDVHGDRCVCICNKEVRSE
jgi:hypothetical protein